MKKLGMIIVSGVAALGLIGVMAFIVFLVSSLFGGGGEAH
jgi:hypothetical protein